MTLRRALTLIFLLCLLLGLMPILSMLVASGISSAAGCMLDEGGSHACIILGADWGETLNVMFVTAWFFFLTFPLAIIGLIGLLIMGVLHLIAAFRR